MVIMPLAKVYWHSNEFPVLQDCWSRHAPRVQDDTHPLRNNLDPYTGPPLVIALVARHTLQIPSCEHHGNVCRCEHENQMEEVRPATRMTQQW